MTEPKQTEIPSTEALDADFVDVQDIEQWFPEDGEEVVGVLRRESVERYDKRLDDAGQEPWVVAEGWPVLEVERGLYPKGTFLVLPETYKLQHKLKNVPTGTRVFIRRDGEGSKKANGKNLIEYTVKVPRS